MEMWWWRRENNRNGVVVEIKKNFEEEWNNWIVEKEKEGRVSKILPLVLEKIGCLRSH